MRLSRYLRNVLDFSLIIVIMTTIMMYNFIKLKVEDGKLEGGLGAQFLFY